MKKSEEHLMRCCEFMLSVHNHSQLSDREWFSLSCGMVLRGENDGAWKFFGKIARHTADTPDTNQWTIKIFTRSRTHAFSLSFYSLSFSFKIFCRHHPHTWMIKKRKFHKRFIAWENWFSVVVNGIRPCIMTFNLLKHVAIMEEKKYCRGRSRLMVTLEFLSFHPYRLNDDKFLPHHRKHSFAHVRHAYMWRISTHNTTHTRFTLD